MPPLASWPVCSGTLAFEGRETPVDCSVEFTSTGEIEVIPADIPLRRDDHWLFDSALGDRGEFFRLFDLSVRTPEGHELTSDHLYMTSTGTASTAAGTGLRLRCRASLLNVRAPQTGPIPAEADHLVLYRTVGMLGFGNVRETCDEGEVIVGGPIEDSKDTFLSGHVTYRRSSVVDRAAWIEACDARTVSVLQVMSLALGRPIEWAVRESWAANQIVDSQFVATAEPPPIADAVFSHLSLQPALDLALANHDQLRHPTLGLGEAIDWVVPWHVLAEIRLLTAATAFEGLLTGHASSAGSLVSGSVFRDRIRPRLEAALNDADVRRAIGEDIGVDASAREVGIIVAEMLTKVGSMNQRSFPTRLREFLDHYDVPLDDLPVTVLDLLKTRNRVVHGADTRSDNPLETVTARAGMMREVLRRTVLAMLGFSGQFQSHLDGPRWVHFRAPPNKVT